MNGRSRGETSISLIAKILNEGDQPLVIDIVNHNCKLDEAEALQIQQICEEQVLAMILENDQSIDLNTQVALVLALRMGWLVDFVSDGS